MNLFEKMVSHGRAKQGDLADDRLNRRISENGRTLCLKALWCEVTIYYIADLVGAACKRDRLISGLSFRNRSRSSYFLLFSIQVPTHCKCHLYAQCMLHAHIFDVSVFLPTHLALAGPTWCHQVQLCTMRVAGCGQCGLSGGRWARWEHVPINVSWRWVVGLGFGRKIEQRLAVKLRFTTHTVQLRIRPYPCG